MILSEQHIRRIELVAKDFEHKLVLDAYPGAPLVYMRELIASHRAQADAIIALQEALEPFAKYGREYIELFAANPIMGDPSNPIYQIHSQNGAFSLTVRDFLRAAEVK